MSKLLLKSLVGATLISLGACSSIGNALNPFAEPPTPEALLGERSDRALHNTATKESEARSALDAMATYRREQLPQPINPVMQPAVVRLMWVPDRLNRSGDLIPAHYYYLKVLGDRWGVQDAFELKGQLDGPRGASSDSNSSIPYVLATDPENKNNR